MEGRGAPAANGRRHGRNHLIAPCQGLADDQVLVSGLEVLAVDQEEGPAAVLELPVVVTSVHGEKVEGEVAAVDGGCQRGRGLEAWTTDQVLAVVVRASDDGCSVVEAAAAAEGTSAGDDASPSVARRRCAEEPDRRLQTQ